MAFCSNCGNELKDNAKFCPNCGNAVNDESEGKTIHQNTQSGINCPKCGSIIPFGNDICLKCGAPLNEEKHTTAIVLGYICALFFPIVGIITGIYLLTRPNKDVHIHGIIMIILAIVLTVIWWILFSYLSYINSMSYYNSYYYY